MSVGSDSVEHMFDTDEIYLLTQAELQDDWMEPDRHLLPDGLETIPPGPFLGVLLETVDPTRLNGHDAVRYVKASSRMEAHFAAKRLAGTAEIAYCPPGGPQADVRSEP